MQLKNETDVTMSRPRIIGALLTKFINKPISIMGTILSVDVERKMFTIKSNDDVTITVEYENTWSPTDLNGIVEVHGTPRTGNKICADYVLSLNSDLEKTYDKDVDNSAFVLLLECGLWEL